MLRFLDSFLCLSVDLANPMIFRSFPSPFSFIKVRLYRKYQLITCEVLLCFKPFVRLPVIIRARKLYLNLFKDQKGNWQKKKKRKIFDYLRTSIEHKLLQLKNSTQ